MSQLDVRSALSSRLAAFATANGNIKIVWENIKTIPTTNHLRAVMFPSPTQDPSFGNKHKRYAGLFRVSYYTTALNVGVGDAEIFAEKIVDYFPRGLRIEIGNVSTQILNTPSITTPGYEGNFMFIVVDIPYSADDISA